MILQVMAIHDRQMDRFMQPFFCQAIGVGQRAFSDMVNDKQHEASKHPEDYSLYTLGTFDDATGLFTAHADANGAPKPERIALATNLIRP